jgi:hypothetical protein
MASTAPALPRLVARLRVIGLWLILADWLWLALWAVFFLVNAGGAVPPDFLGVDTQAAVSETDDLTVIGVGLVLTGFASGIISTLRRRSFTPLILLPTEPLRVVLWITSGSSAYQSGEMGLPFLLMSVVGVLLITFSYNRDLNAPAP